MHNVPHGGLPYNFVRRIYVTCTCTLKIFYEKYRIIAHVESCEFSVDFEIIIDLVLFKSLGLSFRIECAVLAVTYARTHGHSGDVCI